MNSKTLFALTLFLVLPACSSLSTAKEGSPLSSYSSPPVTRKVLENGLTILLKEVPRTPIVSIMAYVKTGSAHEGEWSGSGISHAVEHMLFKGTESRGVGEVEREIRSYGGDMNAFTSHDTTGYTLVVHRDHYPKALAVLADCLTHARFDAAELEKEKEVILNEIRLNRDNPSRRLLDHLWENVYRNHPYRFPVIGHASLLKQLTREDLVQYYHEKYIANNTILVLVGDFHTPEALEAIEENFRAFERRTLSPEPLWNEGGSGGAREVWEEAPVQMAHLALGYYTVSVRDKDMYPLDVLAILLGEGESSRLVKGVRKEKGLVYAIESSHYSPLDPGFFGVFSVLEKEKIQEALRTIQKEIQKIQEGKIDAEELQKAKQQVLTGFFFGRETIQSQSRDLAENEAAGLNVLFSERYVRSIASVTAEDVQRVAKRYLKEDNLTLVGLVPQEASEKNTKKENSLFPRTTAEIRKLTLSNGIRVLLQKESTHPTVSLGVTLLGGLRFETSGTEGISHFTSRMLPKGTTTRSEREISEWVDKKGASFGPFSGQNSFGLRLKILKENMKEGLLLLRELVQDPTFPEEELEKERTLILGEIKAEKDDVFNIGERLLRRTLYTQHPYRFYPSGREETISRLSRKDLIAFYRRLFKTDQMVVTIFGDIDLQKAASVSEALFSGLQTEKSTPPEIPLEPPLTEERSAIRTVTKEQALVLVGFPGISFTDQDFYAFEVLTGVLSGGGGKLFSEIRDKEGKAYTLGAYPVWGLDPGYYVFYVATTKEEVSRVQEKLLAEIASLRQTLIPEEEITRAKESLIGLQKLSLQTAGALSFQTGLDELYGLGHDRYLAYEQKIRSVTSDDLRRIASTYFTPDKKVFVLVLPEGPKED